MLFICLRNMINFSFFPFQWLLHISLPVRGEQPFREIYLLVPPTFRGRLGGGDYSHHYLLINAIYSATPSATVLN